MNRSPRRRLVIELILLFVSLACAACSSEQRNTVETSDNDGVQLTRYLSPVPPSVDPYSLEPGTVFGTDQGSDTYFMSSASPLGVTSDRAVLIRDFREIRIHRFSSNGIHLGAFGGRGAGPGEYNLLNPPVFDGRLLYIYDSTNTRLTILDSYGHVTQTIRLEGDEFHGWRFTVYGPSESRGFLSVDGSTTRDPKTRVPRFRHLEVRLLDAGLELVSIPIDIVQDRPWTLLRGDLSLQVIPPFENLSAVIALSPDQPVAWSFGDEFRIDCYDPTSNRRWAFQIPHESPPVTDQMIEAYLANWARRGLLEVARREIEFPRNLPHIQEMLWDDEGRLWVQEYKNPESDAESHRFQVFSAGGEWLFQQDLSMQPSLIAHRTVYTQSEDEGGNPVVRSYILAKR